MLCLQHSCYWSSALWCLHHQQYNLTKLTHSHPTPPPHPHPRPTLPLSCAVSYHFVPGVTLRDFDVKVTSGQEALISDNEEEPSLLRTGGFDSIGSPST
jgi:hypothetical protein